jgi:Domain of unknown function (DUF4965)/Domain of unknown function (DUF5127)/Domain of unknown function (DUF1793)/Domain of unknown function (DUF4964)
MRRDPSAVATSVVFCLLFLGSTQADAQTESFRPPAVPLVAHDPYFSVWSMNDRLTDEWTKHWTGAINAMCGLARIDGKAYRFMAPAQLKVPTMKQLSVEVLPTRTIYQFEEAGVRLTLIFTTPALLHDLDILARPITYVTWNVRSVDKQTHEVSLYFDASGEWVVNSADQEVIWGRYKVGDLNVMRMGSKEQAVLAKAGDDLRIDWGYLTLAIPPQGAGGSNMASDRKARDGFIKSGKLDDTDDLRMPRAAKDDWPVLACSFDLGKVGEETVSRHLLLAYDDGYSIEYHHKKLRPYWRRQGMEMPALLRQAAKDYTALTEKCRSFDDEIMADLDKAGGARYAKLCALAYRQCVAAHKLVAGPDGTPFYFSKENFSNGCIATVDVTCPSCPFFLLFNTKLLAGQLIPILEYASMPRWKHPYAPHDLGTYPKANGQVYGGGEKSDRDQMPVEECGNMLLMMAALAKTDGNADLAKKYWPLMKQWANYLKDKGLDPENQLCTDDFAGHLAHNTNLSVKAIVALGGYALLCDMVGKKDEGDAFRKTAKDMAVKWVKMADDGDHFRLAFDRPGTWSQSYNLVWDKLLGLNLFPPAVAAKATAFYKTKQEKYGLPLDSRKSYAKLDWTVWTATLAKEPADFRGFVEPLYRFADESTSRVPLTDWYWTHDGKQAGFQARSTVGGIYIKLLDNPAIWTKWSQRPLSLGPKRCRNAGWGACANAEFI